MQKLELPPSSMPLSAYLSFTFAFVHEAARMLHLQVCDPFGDEVGDHSNGKQPSPRETKQPLFKGFSRPNPLSLKDGNKHNWMKDTSKVYADPDEYIQDILNAISKVRSFTIAFATTALVFVALATFLWVGKELRAHRASSKAISEKIHTIFLSDLSAKVSIFESFGGKPFSCVLICIACSIFSFGPLVR